MESIVIAGGTGNLGELLTKFLLKHGYEVLILSRKEKKSSEQHVKYAVWDGENVGSWASDLENAKAIINLSGESINQRFTEENKKRILSSRIKPTKVIGEAIKTLNNPPEKWINISGISIFGDSYEEKDEDSKSSGEDFLARVSQEWERTFKSFNLPNTEQLVVRLSPVLHQDFGLIKSLVPITKFGLGGKVATGKQFISWIHYEDFLRIIHFLIQAKSDTKLYHAAAPEPVSNAAFMEKLRAELHVGIGLPLPSFAAKIGSFFMGTDSSLLLNSQRIVSKNLQNEGFIFNFPTLSLAFQNLLSSK